VKGPGGEADHSPPSNAEVKNAWNLPLHPNTPSWRGAKLKSTGTNLPHTGVECLKQPAFTTSVM